MSYSLFYFDEALHDIKEAKTWYHEHQSGIEKILSESIKETLNRIQKNPQLYAVCYKNIRIAHLKTFPFGIHYFINEQEHKIIIMAILHHKRNPQTVKRRFR